MHKFSPFFRSKLGCEEASGCIFRYHVDASYTQRTWGITTKHPGCSVDVERNEMTRAAGCMDGCDFDVAQRPKYVGLEEVGSMKLC